MHERYENDVPITTLKLFSETLENLKAVIIVGFWLRIMMTCRSFSSFAASSYQRQAEMVDARADEVSIKLSPCQQMMKI